MKKIRFSLLISALLSMSNILPLCIPADANAVSFSTPKGNEGAPRQETTGGASRNGVGCISEGMPSGVFTALLPNNNMGLTVSPRPTFFIYVTKTTAKQASFSLQDAAGNLIYRTKMSLPQSGGAVEITLPQTVKGLEIGANYKWVVEMHCLADIDPDNPLVEGWVRRTEINPNLANKLAAANTLLERAVAYSQEGIWYEALGNLIQARKSQPLDRTLARNWQEFLYSVGLEEIANQAFFD
jgi:Domain of Unknown Function (DUF928)